MPTIKIRYKKDRKVFVPEREVDFPDNYEIEIPEMQKTSLFDKKEKIKEIEDDGKKYFPGFKLNQEVKELLGLLKASELSNLSDKELKNMYHENSWKSSDEKYTN